MTAPRCPYCGVASLFLDPFLLSRMRVGVWGTSTLFVQVDFSKAGPGRWNMAGEPPFFRQRAERSGTSPLRHLLQLEGCLQRTARRRAPCGGCQNISRLPQATEYQEYLAGENERAQLLMATVPLIEAEPPVASSANVASAYFSNDTPCSEYELRRKSSLREHAGTDRSDVCPSFTIWFSLRCHCAIAPSILLTFGCLS